MAKNETPLKNSQAIATAIVDPANRNLGSLGIAMVEAARKS